MRHIRVPLSLCLCLLAGACSTSGDDSPPRTDGPPNLIVILTDDHGYADLGSNGTYAEVLTPNLDQLANDGVKMTRAYVTAPQCSPSRAALLTGVDQNVLGLENNSAGPLDPSAITLAEMLSPYGYVTGMAGKWHLGVDQNNIQNLSASDSDADFTAAAQGFQEYLEGYDYSFLASHKLNGKPVSNAPATITTSTYRIDAVTQWSEQFIKRHRGEPFFLYMSYYAPHVPLVALDEDLALFPASLPAERRTGLAMIHAVDRGVGRIRQELADYGISDNTLIIFLADNGAPTVAGSWDGSLNDPWIGEKGMLTEGGIRIPWLMTWPGHWPTATSYGQSVSSLDIAPTLMAAAGAPIPSQLEGVDLSPTLESVLSVAAPHQVLHWRWQHYAAIQEDGWKYLQVGSQYRFLFDFSADGDEHQNLIEQHPDIAERLQQDLSTWTASLKRPGMPTTASQADIAALRRHGLID